MGSLAGGTGDAGGTAGTELVVAALAAAGMTDRMQEAPATARTAADAAAALGCPVGAIASSLVFLADGEPLLVMTSGRHRVDVALLAAEVGADHAVMAPAKRATALTGQPIGGVAPVGHPAPLRTVVDAALGDYDRIWSSAGTPHTVAAMTFDELVAVTGGTVVRVADD